MTAAQVTTVWNVNDLHAITQLDELDNCVNASELARQVSAVRLAQLIHDRQLFRYQDQPIILWPAVDIDQTGDGIYIVWLPNALIPGTDQHDELREALFVAGAAWLNARLTAGQFKTMTEFALMNAPVRTTYLIGTVNRSPPVNSRPQWTDGITIRPPETVAEKRFVADLLREALRLSLTGGAEKGRNRQADEAAHELVDADHLTLAGTPFQSVIAVADGQLLAHASWIADQRDELTGEPYVDLVDISVAPGLKNRGLAHLLSEPPIEAARVAGIPLIGNVVSQPGGKHRIILENLLRSGAWDISHVVVDLPRP